jgi:hypothetical protein
MGKGAGRNGEEIRDWTSECHGQASPLQPLGLWESIKLVFIDRFPQSAFGTRHAALMSHDCVRSTSCKVPISTANSHPFMRAVCRLPAGVSRQNIDITPQAAGGCRVTVTSFFVNGTSSSACPAGNCNCAISMPIYGTQCGTLYASVYLYMDLGLTVSGPSVATYLNNLGIGNVNMVYGMLYFGLGSSQPVNWSIDVWTNLEVVRTDPDGAVLLCPPPCRRSSAPPTSCLLAQRARGRIPLWALEMLPCMVLTTKKRYAGNGESKDKWAH